jgi:hypothetical protein
MWRPDIGKYTGHMQEPSMPSAAIIKKAQCNVIPQMDNNLATFGGPLLRAWQSDPWNKQSIYYSMGFDSAVCTLAMTNAVGASWVTVPGPFGKAGYTAIPVFEGNAPTNHITSTECGEDCAFTSKHMMATALVGLAVWLAADRWLCRSSKAADCMPGAVALALNSSPDAALSSCALVSLAHLPGRDVCL